MEPKKLAMIFAIAILLPLCIGLFVDALYAEPKYEDYCNDTFYPEYKQPITNVSCPDFSMTSEFQSCINQHGNPTFKYDQNNCQIYDTCDLCSIEFQKVQSLYNRNLFFILAPIALIFIVLGIFLTIEYLGAGFMFGGLILLFYATMRYFSDMSKLLRAIVILVELLIIIYIGYRKIDK
ncbi:hypothetical protein J4465_02975 [Candidatus Pacearchaeota archaeon]|nr:hypothetical protein [Candidatus Pacearchaeota archaeon]